MKRLVVLAAFGVFGLLAGCGSDGIVFNGVKQVEQFPVRKTPIVHYNLPSEVIEAGELDNCGWFQKLWFIVVPMIRPTLINLLTLSVMGKMRIFDLVWIMTGGGPLWSTETVATYVYKRAFDWSTFNLGYPSAIATIWFLVVLTVVIVINVLLRQRDKLEY